VLLAASYLLLAAQKGVAAKWQTQTFSEGVSLEVPALLKRNLETVKDPDMTTIDLWVGVEGQSAYVVSIGHLREPEKAETSHLFSVNVGGMIRAEASKLVGQRDLVIQGWQGLATTFRTSDGITCAARTLRIKNCLIQIMGTFDAKTGRPPQVDRFLNSLKLPDQGDLKEPGAILTRYPLGESGLSALFPTAPQLKETLMGKGTKTVPMFAYSAEYALRTFTVAYLDFPIETKPTDEELDKARYDFTELILTGSKGKKGKQTDEMVGDAPGLLTEYAIGDIAKGRVLVYFQGTRVVFVCEVAPRGYDAPKTIETFFHSVQTAPTKGAN